MIRCIFIDRVEIIKRCFWIRLIFRMRLGLVHILMIGNFFDATSFVTPPTSLYTTHFPRNHRHFPPLCAHKGEMRHSKFVFACRASRRLIYDFSPRACRGFYQLQTRKVESLRRPSNRLQFSSLLHSSQPASAHDRRRESRRRAEPFLTCVYKNEPFATAGRPEWADDPQKKTSPASIKQSGLEPGRAHYDLLRARKESREPRRRRTAAATILWHIWITYCVQCDFLLRQRAGRPSDLFYLS